MAQIADISLELKREVSKGTFIRQTQSICPECNKILPAIIFEREGKVFMTKTCPQHGETEELYFGSYEMFAKFSRYWKDGKGTHAANVPMDVCSCPANCGLCSNHLSHTGLSNIIVTNRCDLTCWYCFFYVKKGLEGAYVYEPTLAQVREMARTLKRIRDERGLSIVVSEQVLSFALDIADRVLVIENGEIVRDDAREGVDAAQISKYLSV